MHGEDTVSGDPEIESNEYKIRSAQTAFCLRMQGARIVEAGFMFHFVSNQQAMVCGEAFPANCDSSCTGTAATVTTEGMLA